MANCFPASGLAYADSFSVGNASSVNSSLYVCSSCAQAVRIEHNFNQTNLHHNTLWLRANNTGDQEAASIGFTVVNCGGDHHRANIEATGNPGSIGGNLALYTRNNNGNDQLGLYINNIGNVSIGQVSPFVAPKVDIRSSCPLTSAVGQALFLGSNDVTGPLGVVIQHISAHGVCRVDITSTRYGISGNDLSLNVDSSDPNTGGGLYIKYRGNVGIGTTSPRFLLDVAGGAMSNFYMSCCNTAIDGVGPYDYGIIGSGNGAGALLINDIVGARYSVTAGSYNLTFRKSVRNTVGSCVYCTVMSFVGTTDTNCIPNVNIQNSLGIGTSSPSYRLHVNGTFYAAGSSIDYKEGICQYNTDSCMFMKLKPVTYQYREEFKHLGKELKSETQIGLIAEDTADVFPELAILVNEEDNKIVRNVDYEKLSIILLSELQKLRKEVDELKHPTYL